MVYGRLGWAEQQVGCVIGKNPIVLFRHRAVETAQPGLDVGYWDV
jgi:hypothetical protein